MTIIALLLGASEWPRHRRLSPSLAFKNSAEGLHAYLEAPQGAGLGIRVKNLFDSDLAGDEISRTFSFSTLATAGSLEAVTTITFRSVGLVPEPKALPAFA